MPEKGLVVRFSLRHFSFQTRTSLLFLVFILYISSGFDVIICTNLHPFYMFHDESVVSTFIIKLGLKSFCKFQIHLLGSQIQT